MGEHGRQEQLVLQHESSLDESGKSHGYRRGRGEQGLECSEAESQMREQGRLIRVHFLHLILKYLIISKYKLEVVWINKELA